MSLAVPIRRAPLDSYAPVRGKKAWLASRSDGKRLHAGVDLAAPPGRPVYAPESGEVVLAGDADTMRRVGGWGWRGYGPEIVVIKGSSGRYHLLSHVRSVRVREGGRVEQGAHVADVSSLAHVHWEVRRSLVPPPRRAQVEVALEPLAWLAGVDRAYRPGQDPCPSVPTATLDCPWPCRPGSARGSPMPEDFDDAVSPAPGERRVRVIEEPLLVTARRPVPVIVWAALALLAWMWRSR